MDVEVSPTQDQVKELFESTYQTKISSLETLNSSTYSVISDNKYLVKLFSDSLITLEQLQSILSSCELNETILNTSINQSHVVIINNDNLLSNKQLGHFLAQWRLNTRNNLNSSLVKPFNDEWFNQQYALIINKKKNSYPFLLSNLFTCQQQISSISSEQLELGLLWTNSEQSYYLIDLAVTFLTDIDSFKEIINFYEEIIPLTNEEINFLDIFVRLQLVFIIK
jgi:hypothetical protein